MFVPVPIDAGCSTLEGRKEGRKRFDTCIQRKLSRRGEEKKKKRVRKAQRGRCRKGAHASYCLGMLSWIFASPHRLNNECAVALLVE